MTPDNMNPNRAKVIEDIVSDVSARLADEIKTGPTLVQHYVISHAARLAAQAAFGVRDEAFQPLDTSPQGEETMAMEADDLCGVVDVRVTPLDIVIAAERGRVITTS
jgi:hypothetical protein